MVHRFSQGFQEGLGLEIQEHMAMIFMDTYAEVLEIARQQKQVIGKSKAELG